jgi:hypothetical protein
VQDGLIVAYAGVPGEVQPGDQGEVLSSDYHYAHVLWRTGAMAGQVRLHDQAELDMAPSMASPRGHIEASLDDSLEVGGTFQLTSARQAYDEDGPAGVLEVMASGGQLDMLSEVTDEVYALVTSRVRTNPYVRSITAQLDEDEAEAVVLATSASLIRDLLVPEE